MANVKKLGAVALIAVLGILAISGSVAVKGIDFYGASVSLKGDMVLKFYNETYPALGAEKNFTAIIPSTISPGEYNATFEGIAWIDDESVRFFGNIMTENGTFTAEFAVPNGWTGIPTGKCGASGTLIVTLSKIEIMPGPPPPVQQFYTAEVDLAGSMQLKDWYFHKETYNITVAQSFTAMVPTEITPGDYSAIFKGIARVDNESVRFAGAIKTENGTFIAEFAVPNAWPEIPTDEWCASGTLTITLTEITPPPPVLYNWVHVDGLVTQYGPNASRGCLDAHAKISPEENVTKAHVFWMPTPPLEEKPTGNFTYSFYHAKLINTAIVALNYSGNDFYVSGLWTVYNVTFIYHDYQGWEEHEEDIFHVAQNRTGELKVYGGWTNFTVSIDGFDDIQGLVTHYVTHARAHLEGDFFGRGRIDIYDLVHVAKYIGCTPKTPTDLEEIERVDMNHDTHVDIYDLVTVASEIGQTD